MPVDRVAAEWKDGVGAPLLSQLVFPEARSAAARSCLSSSSIRLMVASRSEMLCLVSVVSFLVAAVWLVELLSCLTILIVKTTPSTI